MGDLVVGRKSTGRIVIGAGGTLKELAPTVEVCQFSWFYQLNLDGGRAIVEHDGARVVYKVAGRGKDCPNCILLERPD